MEDTPTIAAARRFVNLIAEGAPPSDTALIFALDTLAMAYHLCPEGDPADSNATPARADFGQVYRRLKTRFPDFTSYRVVDPLSVDQSPMSGDPIDDLADISGDLSEVIWRFGRLGIEDAHWHFRCLYEIHWGRHLRELSLYLHARLVTQ